MQKIYETFPVLLFIIVFKMYGIYIATMVGIAATLLAVFVSWLHFKKWDRTQLFTLIVFIIFGGMTLYFRDPIFVKWKPTIIFWAFALVIFGSHFFTRKPLMQRLTEKLMEKKAVPEFVWKRLNLMWAIFFVILGSVNLYIAYYFSDDAWVNFKFFGITSALFVFSLLQAWYLMRHSKESET
jgi:intracellular septation protein